MLGAGGIDIMKTKTMVLVILIQILALGISSAEIYKWVDENGVTHYSDSPTEMPAEFDEDEVEEIQTPESASAETPRLPDETPKNTRGPDSSNNPGETQEDAVAVSSPSVEIYETSWCRYCNKTKNFFRSRGIDFVTYDIEKDEQAARRMRSLTNLQAVPFVVINGRGISGYSVAAYEQALQN
jgi:glutaredoxin